MTAAPLEPPPNDAPPRARVRRIFKCVCGRPIFFRNSKCLACGRGLGYVPESGEMIAVEPAYRAVDRTVDQTVDRTVDQTVEVSGDQATDAAADQPAEELPLWMQAGADGAAARYRRCANFENAAACNWLLPENELGGYALCRCCRLNRTVPDQSYEFNRTLWRRVEMAKRRMVSSLISLGLPVASLLGEDPQCGMAFDLLINAASALPVMTGHSNGIITLNADEADDATREAVRSSMHEPYRTVLGHLRHESGHYYWNRLVENTSWHEPFREVFGDERSDYGLALQTHYTSGPAGDWALRHVSAYASAHPWEDWAETWAHYLHMIDSLETAQSAGLDSSGLELLSDPFKEDVLRPVSGGAPTRADLDFLDFLNQWVELAGVVNELSRSMGQHDFYPFVLNVPAVTKLHFVHQVVQAQTAPHAPTEQAAAAPAALAPGEPTMVG